MSPTTVVCTIAAKNYLPSVRCLMDSIERHHPEWVRSVILADRVDGCFDPAKENFEVILSSDLQIPASDWFHFKYTLLELCTALKPYALELLLDRHRAARILYLDPDIKVYRPLEPVLEMLERHPLVLTPHLTEPLDDGFKPGELEILQSGAYNLGFVALAAIPATHKMLEWWQEKLYNDCLVDIPGGLFVDQRWMDLAPSLFPDTGILRHPGCNVAYWNVKQREVRAQNGVYTVQGQPLYFFHFSGFDAENPEPFSRHQNRVRLSGLGEAAPLVLDYGRDLMARGWAECKKWPYAYGSFRNGVRIVDMGRQMYREAPGLSGHIQDPFSDQGHQAFLEFWNEPLLDSTGQGAGLTRLAYKIYRGRTDVRAAMPDVWGLDRVAFLQWMAERSPVEHGIQDELIEPVRRALQAAKAAEALNRMKSRPSPPPEEPAAVNDGQAARARLPRLAQSIYELRPDLHKAFPDVLGRDRARFLRWLLVYGKEEFRLDEALLAPIREHWERTAAEAGSLPARLRMKAGLLVWSHVAETRKRVAAGMSRQRSNQALAEAKATDVPSAAAGAAPNPDGLRFGVNLVGHLRSELSVGETVRLAAEAARAAGLPVSLKNIGHDNPFRQQDFRAGPLSHVFPYCFNVFHVNADEFPKVAATQAEPLLKGKYNIGFWVWETEEFPDRWLNSFSHLHEVWAPSAFCQEAIARKSPVPVLRIPYAISAPAPEGVAREHLGLPGEGFLFLMIFDMLSCFERKNPLGLIEAFKRAFGGAPQYRLAIKISNGYHRPVFLERLHARAEGLPVTILDEVIPRDKMNAMIAACDCLVSLHRSEGFGLTLAEAMYLGKPVIATGYSGNLDFTLPSTSFLVDYRLCEVGKDCEPYDAGSVWAEPSLDHAAAQMRAVAGNPELRGRVAEAGQRFVRDRFSPLFVGRRMVERLNHLLRTRLVQA